MLTVTKTDQYILLSKLNCPDKAIAGIWGHHGGANLKITQSDDDEALVRVGPVPERLCNGVYDFVVQNDGCRCYSMKVNVRMQDEPVVPIVHTPTDPNAGETIMECCESDTEETDDDQS